MKDPKKNFPHPFEDPFSKHPSEGGQNGHIYPSLEPRLQAHLPKEEEGEEEERGCVLTDEIDHHILMHRDAHFGGDFTVMLHYYNDEASVGVHPDFDPERISYLAEVEKGMGKDLAPLILTGPEAEKVAQSRERYAQLKKIYEVEDPKNPFPRLLADLILTEEEDPLHEIGSIVSQGSSIVPDLLALLNSDELYDPLFPGYGYAPYLAILCLGKIGDPRAIIAIFETLSKEIVFDEMAVVEALAELGAPAQAFLLKTLKGRPLTQDNSNAAFALTAFSQDPQVAIASFEQLQDPEVQEKPLLRVYLLCNCVVLDTTPYRESFIQMAQDPKTPFELRTEMEAIIQNW
jgi:hypothetical protein